MKLVIVTLSMAAILAAACTVPSPLPTEKFEIDQYCTVEARVGGTAAQSWVDARDFGVLQGPGPYEGCRWWDVFHLTLVTTAGTWECGLGHPTEGEGTPGIGGGCTTYPGAAIPPWSNDWLRTHAQGSLVSATVIVVNGVTGDSRVFTVHP